MDKKVTVLLNDITKAKEFNNEASTYDECDIDLVRGRYVIDAKSIMGIFSLDLSKPVDVVIHSDNEEEINRFIEAMKKFA